MCMRRGDIAEPSASSSSFFVRQPFMLWGTVLSTWTLLTGQRGIEPPPAVCQRRQERRPTNWATRTTPLLPLAALAPAFMNLGDLAAARTLERLLRTKAPATLRRHLSLASLGWFRAHEWSVFEPPESDIVAFLQGFVTNGKFKDGGQEHLVRLEVCCCIEWRAGKNGFVKLCTAKLCLENQNKTYRDQSYPKAFPQIHKRESNFPCSLAEITPDNKQRFNTHSVSLARAWANECRWMFSPNTV